MFSDGVYTLGDGETRGKSLGIQIRFRPNPTTSVKLHVFWGIRGPEAVLEKQYDFEIRARRCTRNGSARIV